MNNFKNGGFKKRGNDFGEKPKFRGDRGDRSGRGGGDKKFSGHNRSGGRPSESFKAECSKCHKACTLPFSPNSDKPVFCSDCFAKRNAENDRGDGRRDNDRGGRNDYSKPREHRPAQNERPQAKPNRDIIELKQQLTAIESRLNRILDIINPPVSAKKAVVQDKTVIEKVVEAKAPVEKKKAKSKPVKKVVEKSELKKAVKKAIAKKAPAKVAKKAAPAKKVTKKTVVKKVVKKATKKKK